MLSFVGTLREQLAVAEKQVQLRNVLLDTGTVSHIVGYLNMLDMTRAAETCQRLHDEIERRRASSETAPKWRPEVDTDSVLRHLFWAPHAVPGTGEHQERGQPAYRAKVAAPTDELDYDDGHTVAGVHVCWDRVDRPAGYRVRLQRELRIGPHTVAVGIIARITLRDNPPHVVFP